jgi:hypothetical protein
MQDQKWRHLTHLSGTKGFFYLHLMYRNGILSSRRIFLVKNKLMNMKKLPVISTPCYLSLPFLSFSTYLSLQKIFLQYSLLESFTPVSLRLLSLLSLSLAYIPPSFSLAFTCLLSLFVLFIWCLYISRSSFLFLLQSPPSLTSNFSHFSDTKVSCFPPALPPSPPPPPISPCHLPFVI